MEREIVRIDEDLCNGCGECVPGCHEGALQIIDGKARLISDLMCDGLGACLGHCPQGAISIEKREAEPYDEAEVMKSMTAKGKNTIIAHMKHLKDHNEDGFLRQAVSYLKENKSDIDFDITEVISEVHNHGAGCGTGGKGGGCPGSQAVSFTIPGQGMSMSGEDMQTQVSHWPVQMHLINPAASHYRGSDMVLAADCVAYSLPGFHQKYLKGKTLAIACPKLDRDTEVYIDKIKSLIDDAGINTLQLMIMQVPCCGGLLHIVRAAQAKAERNIPVKQTVVSIKGEILSEEWL